MFALLNDRGFVHKTLYVWETLTTITGDSQFVDQYFKNAVAEMERKEGFFEFEARVGFGV